MDRKLKTKRRGFVMAGGGAKGLYEAGVIHAFHLTGMEFDVITGSSIGAMNSVFYAEYLFCKRQLPEDVQKDSQKAIESMDGMVKAFHHAWLMMPEKHIIDDSEEGRLGKLKDDLSHLDLSVSQLTNIIWWYTDPKRGVLPPPRLWPDVLYFLKEFAERINGAELLRIFKDYLKSQFSNSKDDPLSQLIDDVLRTYLKRFSLDRSLVPEEDNTLKDIFTTFTSPLRAEHLAGGSDALGEERAVHLAGGSDAPNKERYRLVDPKRTLRDYADKKIHVRLTRANYRTGRLEVSAYTKREDFTYFLDKQLWRILKVGSDKLPIGSFRIEVPGNPLAIDAAICSGRFPGVFLPYPLTDIYPKTDTENSFLYKCWSEKLLELGDDANKMEVFRDFFPQANDTYIDGGAIDNTPYTSAFDYLHHSLQRSPGASMRSEILELYVVYLETEPKVDKVDQDNANASNPDIVKVVRRTWAFLKAANENGRANTFPIINDYGKHAEDIAYALELVLKSYQETLKKLNDVDRNCVEDDLRERAKELNLIGFRGETPERILDRMLKWTTETLTKLPLQVETVKIYPEEMPLGTLQFTERFGYKQENAIQMLTMGCYNTLVAIRTHLEPLEKKKDLDKQDMRTLDLVRQWTGDEREATEPDQPKWDSIKWRCRRTECTFYAKFCNHGEHGAKAD